MKNRSDFLRLQSKGEKLYAKHFLVSVLPNNGHNSRLGIAVTKKVAPLAVHRNTIKRRIREVFRHSLKNLQPPMDIVVVARREAMQCTAAELENEILGALRRGGYLGKP